MARHTSIWGLLCSMARRNAPSLAISSICEASDLRLLSGVPPFATTAATSSSSMSYAEMENPENTSIDRSVSVYEALTAHVLDAATGGVLFLGGVSAAQVAQKLLRIGSASGFLLPQAEQRGRSWLVLGARNLKPPTAWRHAQRKVQERWEDLPQAPYPVYMVMGLLCFKLLGGRMSALAPSPFADLGAFHLKKASLPATVDYATSVERGIIQEFGRLYGCHTCGVKRGVRYHADHMPPKLVAKRNDEQLFRRILGRKTTFRFYPQCEPCSNQQASVVKQWKSTLKMHLRSFRAYHSTGLWLVLLCTGWNDRFTLDPPPKSNKVQSPAHSPTFSTPPTPLTKESKIRDERVQYGKRGGKRNREPKKPSSGKLVPLGALSNPPSEAAQPTKEEKLRFKVLKAIDARETLLYQLKWMLEAGAQAETPPPFLWRGRNYFLKMVSDLDFAETELPARGVNLDCFRQTNPLLIKPNQKLGRVLAAHSIIMEMVEFAKDMTPMELLALSGRMRDSSREERGTSQEKFQTQTNSSPDLAGLVGGDNSGVRHSMGEAEDGNPGRKQELERHDHESAADLVDLLDESLDFMRGNPSRESVIIPTEQSNDNDSTAGKMEPEEDGRPRMDDSVSEKQEALDMPTGNQSDYEDNSMGYNEHKVDLSNVEAAVSQLVLDLPQLPPETADDNSEKVGSNEATDEDLPEQGALVNTSEPVPDNTQSSSRTDSSDNQSEYDNSFDAEAGDEDVERSDVKQIQLEGVLKSPESAEITVAAPPNESTDAEDATAVLDSPIDPPGSPKKVSTSEAEENDASDYENSFNEDADEDKANNDADAEMHLIDECKYVLDDISSAVAVAIQRSLESKNPLVSEIEIDELLEVAEGVRQEYHDSTWTYLKITSTLLIFLRSSDNGIFTHEAPASVFYPYLVNQPREELRDNWHPSSFGEKLVDGVKVEEGEGKGPLKEWFGLVGTQLASKWKQIPTNKFSLEVDSTQATASGNAITIPGAADLICPGFMLEWETSGGEKISRVVNKCGENDTFLLDREYA
uniref:Uncharacterized protein n=1 Tax=Phytophthora ramorum TaxID=164328 RepID=H3HDH8_PHYRM